MGRMKSCLALGMILVTCSVRLGLATRHIVGNRFGWTTGLNYSLWAKGKTFSIGDQLVFNYDPQRHTVSEVSEEDFRSCSAANPISTDNSGSTNMIITSPGMHYFICGIPGHCSGGMNVAIIVQNSPLPSTDAPCTPEAPCTPNAPIYSWIGAGVKTRVPGMAAIAGLAGLLITVSIL